MKMKERVLTYLIYICACVGLQPLYAQVGNGNSQNAGNAAGSAASEGTGVEEDPCVPLSDHRRCFTLDPLSGLVRPCVPDTSYIGLGNRQSMESLALAINHTGNLYSPHLVESFFDRRTSHDFLFANAYSLFRTDPSQQIYYNTKIPFTIINYTNSGSNLQENDRLRLNFAGNFNQQIGIGSQLDYVYARGEYMNQSTKPLRWTSYAYYEGEQYKAYANFNLSKLANQENGGITDRGYILNPDNYNDNFTDPKNMPTQLNDTWNETDVRQLHFQHSYDFGFWDERIDPSDSSAYDEFVPVASIFHNIDFEYMHHNFIMGNGGNVSEKGDFFTNEPYYDKHETHDSTTYRDFSTYAGIRLNEGFNKYSQFGISAFVGFEHQNFRMFQDTLDLKYINRLHCSNTLWVGGQMSRHLSSELTFDITAKTALSGDKLGDLDVSGVANTVIPFGRRNPETGQRSDSLIIEGRGHLRNTHVSYMMEHYFGNYFRWKNGGFKSEKHVGVEGIATYPRTGTSVRAGIEHISKFHYFGSDGLPTEYGKQLEIFALEARQKFTVGKWLAWENAVLVQTSSDDKVLALPAFSIESDFSLFFTIARTLHIQAGVTGYYHSKYYAPEYQPATQQFCTQHDIKCGGYPLLNGYLNCNLKRIKFFIAMRNLLDGTVTNDAFHMPYYPVQPRRLEYGVVLDLQN